ncbi:MAG: hypothetical protein KAS23_09615, partial [Anaerohalosphaera sp.]|nr:hypothetical protein [Anaerohalosphaera sp.]
DYESFLRGADNDPGNTTGMEDNIRAARMGSGYDPLVDTAARYHNEALMNIENTGLMYNLFDIGDELEIANRYMLSSQTQARFENVAHFTFDAGGGIYSALEVPIESNANFKIWKWRVDPRNFADEKYTNPLDGSPIDNLNIYRYDRRHVCTFYSFDKLWRREYPYVYYDAFDTANCAADNSSVHGEIKPGYSYEFDLGGPDENTFILDDMFMPWTGPVSIRNIQMIDSGLVTDAGIRYEQRKLVRKNVLHLLYALRAHFINETDISDLLTDPEDAINIAAIKAAQTVANMIDYIDGASDTMEGPFSEDDTALVLGYDFGDQKNENPTYIDRHIIRSLILEASNGVIDLDEDLSDGESRYPEYEFGLIPDDQTDLDIWGDTVYGYERQPFITEMNAYNDLVNNTHFGIELYNPYNAPIYLAGQPDDIQWRVSIGRTVEYDIGDYNIEFDETQLTAEQAEIEASTGGDTGRLLLLSAIDPIKLPFNAGTAKIVIPALAGSLSPSNIVKLQRRNPKWEDGDPEKYKFIVVDQTTVGQTLDLLFASNTTLPLVSKRDDEMWRFVTPEGSISTSVGNIPTLGSANNVTFSPTPISIQLPVANNDIPLMTLNDLEYILSIGNSIATGPGSGTVITRSITDQISYVSAEDEVRFDVESTPELLDYVFFMNRPNIGNLPGRININTASREVLRSAIVPDDQWDVDELVDNIVKYREDPTKGPFKSIL